MKPAVRRALALGVLAAAVLGVLAFRLRPRQTQYTTTWFDLFDTLSVVRGYARSQEEWDAQMEALHADLLHYHQLFDIYHHYDGMTNLYDVNAGAAAAPVAVSPELYAFLEWCAGRVWEQTGGVLDIFVAGTGTGGTLTGTGRFLREKKPDIQLIAVEPAGSPVLTQGKAGPHGLQGMGAGFVPQVMETSLFSEVLACTEEQAYAAARQFARTEGILVGISSGAALWAACQVGSRPENEGKSVAVLLPDTGDRYLSTPLFEEDGEE